MALLGDQRALLPHLLLCLMWLGRAAGLDNGLALTPPMAWTSWDLCRFEVNATLIKGVAEALNASGLRALGWDTLQIDEACLIPLGTHSYRLSLW
jgi:hypothetical protein